MKVSLHQLNPIIGDFSGNCAKILAGARRAADGGCSLAIFPELCVSGYPPLDLLERSSFVADHHHTVAALVTQLPDIDVMFGCFESNDTRPGKPLYNSVMVARGGAIVHKTRKRLLPAYDVFDENRYFQPGDFAGPVRLGDAVFGITVCEDIWHDAVDEYQVDPVAELFETTGEGGKPPDFLVNVSASPFDLEKGAVRDRLFGEVCRRYARPLFFVNQVGGQDSLLFDGASAVYNACGTKIQAAGQFAEDMVVVETDDFSASSAVINLSSTVRLAHDALIMGISDYLGKSGFTSALVGLSGGIDSAVTLALAVRALGHDKVMGVAMPSRFSSAASIADARELAKRFRCRFEVLPIELVVEQFQGLLAPLFAGCGEDVTEQNIQARVRGTLLMALSNKFGHLLLATGNKSELAVGYCTLYGDMSGGLAVLADVPKQLVYQLAYFINEQSELIPTAIIDKPPSAELAPGQRDDDDLPPYELLDQILELYLEEGVGSDELIERGFDAAVVTDIVGRIHRNEYKRKQAPMGLKVSSKAFGIGRRLPNVQKYLK
jgi:NAD+ synthase (glutamine-hydrolysing)